MTIRRWCEHDMSQAVNECLVLAIQVDQKQIAHDLISLLLLLEKGSTDLFTITLRYCCRSLQVTNNGIG